MRSWSLIKSVEGGKKWHLRKSNYQLPPSVQHIQHPSPFFINFFFIIFLGHHTNTKIVMTRSPVDLWLSRSFPIKPGVHCNLVSSLLSPKIRACPSLIIPHFLIHRTLFCVLSGRVKALQPPSPTTRLPSPPLPLSHLPSTLSEP